MAPFLGIVEPDDIQCLVPDIRIRKTQIPISPCLQAAIALENTGTAGMMATGGF
jgi:hypothetical protein